MALPYELKVYHRDKNFRAPKELEAIHPLGKSPVVEVVRPGRQSLILAETPHIIRYLIDNYDPEGILRPTSADDAEKVDYWLDFTEGSLQGFLVSLLVNDMAKSKAPWGVGFLVLKVVEQINAQYYSPETLRSLNFVEKTLAASASGYIVGDKLSGADICLTFPIIDNILSNPQRALGFLGGANVNDKFPALTAWAKKVSQDPAYINADKVVQKPYESSRFKL